GSKDLSIAGSNKYRIDNYVRDAVRDSVKTALRALLLQSFRDLSKVEMKEMLADHVTIKMNFMRHCLDLERDSVMIKILLLHLLHKTMMIKILLLLLQETLIEVKGRSRILRHLHHNSLQLIHSNDNDNAHVPKVKPRAEWLKHVLEEDQPASPKPEWVIPLNELPEFENNWADALAETYRDPDENKLISKTRDMGSFVKWYCKQIGKKKLTKADLEDQVDLVNLEGHRIMPNVSEPLPLGGPPGQEIVLRRADYNEYKISEKDFKNLHPNDFEDLNLLHLQEKLNHLSREDKLIIESYQTKLNLEQPNWDAFDFLFKEYYTIVYKPRADKLAYMVKDFKLFKYNKGMESRIWTEDDKRRSEDFIEVIKIRLKTRESSEVWIASLVDD
ncbi:hypothetical protein Tco_0956202, partial [Tanacetum coccineum]